MTSPTTIVNTGLSTLKLALILIVSLMVGIILFWLWNSWRELERLKTAEQQWKASSQATTQTITAVSEKTEEKQKVEFIITDRRAASDRRFEEVKREDQTAADWAATPIPDSVRGIDAAETIDGTPSAGSGGAGADRAAPGRRGDPDPQ